MSGVPTSYEDWYKTGVAAAIPWLAGGPNGQAEAGAWPRFLDDILLNYVTQARYCAFPDYAPIDALPHLGGDRRLVQGSNEAQADFRARLKNPWDQWARAGTWLGMLCQIYWFGLTNAVIVQKNGKAATLTGAPVINTDPTSLYSFTDVGTVPVPLTSRVTPPTKTSVGRSIPVGTPFFAFDSNTDFCSQFAVLIPSFLFARLGYATFSDNAIATVTWSVAFPDVNYGILTGAPAVLGAVINEDSSTRTTGQITLVSSANLSARIPVLAWENGVNPFNVWSDASTGLLKSIVENWRPMARCSGVYVYQTSTGAWGWPVRKWGDGTKWGATSVVQLIGPF